MSVWLNWMLVGHVRLFQQTEHFTGQACGVWDGSSCWNTPNLHRLVLCYWYCGLMLRTPLGLAEMEGVGCCLRLLFLSAAHMLQSSDCSAEITEVWPRVRIGRGHMTMVPLIGPPLFNRHSGKKWSAGSCVSFETAGLTSACGPWVISDSQHGYIDNHLAFVSWHSPTGCASRLWKMIDLIWVRLWDVSLANV